MNYKYRKIKTVYCTKEEIDEILATALDFDNYRFEKPPADKQIRGVCYIEDNPVNLVITGRALDKKESTLKRWVFAKDGREPEEPLEPGKCYREMTRKAKVHDLIRENKKWDNFTSSALIESSVKDSEIKEFEEVFAYDTNLTYFHLLSQDMPDTRNPLGKGFVEKGQAGFNITSTNILGNDGKLRSKLKLTKEGKWADFRFPLVESPFKNYVEFKLDQLKEIEELKEVDKEAYSKRRGRIKGSIVISVGNMQHHNSIMRAWIVETGNERIKALKDSNTIACNTDCIYSTAVRPDLPLSNKVGDFKIEHHGKCTVKGCTFTWETGEDNQRGFKNNNIYYFDKERMAIYEI